MIRSKEAELPKCWTWSKLGDFLSNNGKSIIPNKNPDELFELYSVPKYDCGLPEIVSGNQIGSNKQIVKKDAVLLCKINPRINRVWIVGDYSPHQKIASTEWIPFFKSNGIDPKYLCYFMKNYYFRDFLSSNASGVGGSLMRIKAATLSDYPIPIAPPSEQHRIVARIEELFSRLDAGVVALQRAKIQLQRYRQSVLKAAMEGRLTEAWRKAHPDVEPAEKLLELILKEKQTRAGRNYKEPSSPNIIGLPQLPEGWVWASLEQLSEQIVDCLHSTPEFTSAGRYCVDTTCIEPGRILFDKARFVSDDIYKERIQRLKPEPGDVLFSREGTIGTAITVPDNVEFCLGQRMMMFRPANGIISSYFMWSMLSNIFGTQWKPKVTGTTAPHVNIRDLKVMALPLTSNDEQVKIIEEIECRLSITKEIEKYIGQDLTRAVRFRQSILKHAFEGKLVPQDPRDEPASVLLERIKAEKTYNTTRRGSRITHGASNQMRLTQ